MFDWHSMILMLIIIVFTFLVRLLPYLVFKKHNPHWVIYLGQVFPYAIMALLFIYSMKDIKPISSRGLAALISLLVIYLLHKWRHNTILSILSGTIVYMVLVQTVLG